MESSEKIIKMVLDEEKSLASDEENARREAERTLANTRKEADEIVKNAHLSIDAEIKNANSEYAKQTEDAIAELEQTFAKKKQLLRDKKSEKTQDAINAVLEIVLG